MDKLKQGINKIVNKTKPFHRNIPDYDSQPQEGYIRLYHNTPNENLDSISKNGLLVARPNSPRTRKAGYLDSEGDVIWATNKSGSRGYGGNTIAFDVPLNHRMKKVNDDEYILYDDVKPENIKFIDRVFTSKGELNKISDLKEYVDIAKHQNKDKEWLKQTLNQFYANEYLDDDDFDYYLDYYWNK